MTPAAAREQAARDALQDKVRSTIRQFVRDWSEEVCSFRLFEVFRYPGKADLFVSRPDLSLG